MKTFLNLKNKANALSKERLEQIKSGKPAEGGNLKPQEESNQHDLGPVDASNEVTIGAHPSSTTKQGVPKAPPPGKVERDSVLESLVQSERRDAVKEEFFKEPTESYTNTRHLNIKAATYNVNGRRPPSSLDLSPWLDLSSHPADIIAIGFQEIVPLNAQNIVLGGNLEASADWEKLIDVCLNGPGDRLEGHLVMPSSAGTQESQRNTPSPRKKANDDQKQSHSSSVEGSPHGAPTDGMDAKTPRSIGEATAVSDELEGYMSPQEDFASILSDDHIAPRSYIQVVGKQMVGVYLSVWVKRALLKHVRGVQTTTVATGMMGYLGNKGAVAARMRIFDSGVCFISTHLSSGEQEGDEWKRNSDYAEIIRRASFPSDASSMEPDALSQRMNGAEGAAEGQCRLGVRSGQWGASRGVLETSHAIWLGDLNYRLNAPDAQARSLVKSADWASLSSKDQLNIARKERQAFQGWEEGPLTFAPTYKFKRGTSQYVGAKDDDQDEPPAGAERGQKSEVEKTRTPAWTDRILWRSQGGLRQTSYGCGNLFVSDHKPVVASFSLVARDYDRTKIQLTLESAKSAVQEREAAAIPRCELEPHRIEAGVVTYAEAKTVHTVLRNSGQVPAQWSFVPISGLASENNGDYELRPFPKWVQADPTQGELPPGESVEIQMRIWVDGGKENSADYLVSLLKKKLDAIMVLRVEEGNEVFCTIAGNLNPSFFGLSLTVLASMPRPICPAEGWESGSPKLKINTKKSLKRRQPSDGPPAAFYSPAAVIPELSFDEAMEAEGKNKQHSRRSSLDGTHAESAHVHAHAESGVENFFSPKAPSTNTTGLSSVDQMFEAFGIQPEYQLSTSGRESPQHTTRAAQEHHSVPPELKAMTDFLLDKERLNTKNLFVGCMENVRLWEPRTPQNCLTGVEKRRHLPAVQQIRKSLDRGQGVPGHVEAQDVAAAIVCFFLALPDPFLPQEAASGHSWATSRAASDRLQPFMPPPDLAVAQHMIGFLRKLLRKETAEKNGLTRSLLAPLFAELWFTQSVEVFQVTQVGKTSESKPESEDVRTAREFVLALLQEDSKERA